MDMKWLGVGLQIAMAVQLVEQVVKDPTKTKQQKALEIIDASILAVGYSGVDKGVLAMAEVQAAKKSAIDSLVAFENAVAAAKAKLHPTVLP